MTELSIEQQLIKHMLHRYVWANECVSDCRREHHSDKYWKEQAEYYKKEAAGYKKEKNWWMKHSRFWRKYATGETDEKPDEAKKPKKKSRVNDIGLKLIDGGKKPEERPPLAN